MIKITFDQKGDFVAMGEAQKWCDLRGISVGSMAREMPIGIKVGNYSIAKWYNLSEEDKKLLDGTITGESKRSGPIVLEISEEAFIRLEDISDPS